MIDCKWCEQFNEGYPNIIMTMESCVAMGKHEEVTTCQCGDNRICYNCGYGRGSYPCRCQNSKLSLSSFDEVMEEVLEDRAEAWGKLANG
jgi:hypothetical protein